MKYYVIMDELTEIEQRIVSQLEDWKSQLNDVCTEMENYVQCLEDNGSGELVEEIKRYIRDVHIEKLPKQFLLVIEEIIEKIKTYTKGYCEIEINWKEGKIAQESLEEQQMVFQEVSFDLVEKTDEVEVTLNEISDIIGKPVISTALIEAGLRTVSAKIESLKQTIGESEETHKESDFVAMEELMSILEGMIGKYTNENVIETGGYLQSAVEKYIQENGIQIISVPNREKQVEFLNSILEGAVEVYLVTGVPWQVTLAQAAQETGWGSNLIVDMYTGENSNNLFGIKYNGSPDNVNEYVRCWTTEWVKESEIVYWKSEHEKWALNNEELVNTGITDGNGNIKIKVIQPFKRYASANESIIGHSEVLDGSVYELAKKYINDPYKYAKEISQVYATDPNYYKNIISIINKYLQWNGKGCGGNEN